MIYLQNVFTYKFQGDLGAPLVQRDLTTKTESYVQVGIVSSISNPRCFVSDGDTTIGVNNRGELDTKEKQFPLF